MRKLTIIRPDGTVTTEVVKKATLEHLQAIVGGYIESVPHFTRYAGAACKAWCNEEGRLIPLTRNGVATKLWVDQCKHLGSTWYEPEIFGTLVIDQKTGSA